MARILDRYVTIPGAVAFAKRSEQALRKAIDRGELTPETTYCGRAKLLKLADVRKWAAIRRKPGPKAKA